MLGFYKTSPLHVKRRLPAARQADLVRHEHHVGASPARGRVLAGAQTGVVSGVLVERAGARSAGVVEGGAAQGLSADHVGAGEGAVGASEEKRARIKEIIVMVAMARLRAL